MIKWVKRYGVAGPAETVQLADSNGDPYTAGDSGWTFVCNVWPGDDRATTTTLPAVWDDAAAGTIAVSFPLATMQALDVGFYNVEIKKSDGSLDCAFGTLQVIAGPGSATAGNAYHTYKDLEDELPWVGDLRDHLRDQTGFAEAAQDAWHWINAAILKAKPVSTQGVVSRQNYWWWDTPAGGSGGTYPPLGEDTTLADWLTDGKLMTTTATGRMFVRASVFYTLGQILSRAVGLNTGVNVVALASRYSRMADETLSKCVAEIDTNDDGVSEYVIPLSLTNTRFG